MAWRTVVIGSRSKLDLKMNYLIVRNEEIHKIYIKDIDVLVIDSLSVSLTAALLNELNKNKTKVIFCDEAHNPSCELLSKDSNVRTSLKIHQQINWSEETKQKAWTKIVDMKIYNQSTVLRKLNLDQYQLLLDYRRELELNDVTNREGHAAKVYFNALFGKEFSRSDDSNPLNGLLNYAYAILMSIVNREIVCNGYLTQLGIFHDNQFNSFNLACDFMEVFRPVIDYFIYNLHTTELDKKKLLSLFNDRISYQGKEFIFTNAISNYVRSVLDFLSSAGEFPMDEFYYEL